MTETIEVYTLNVRLAGETKTLSFSKDDDVYELLKEKFPMYIVGNILYGGRGAATDFADGMQTCAHYNNERN